MSLFGPLVSVKIFENVYVGQTTDANDDKSSHCLRRGKLKKD